MPTRLAGPAGLAGVAGVAGATAAVLVGALLATPAVAAPEDDKRAVEQQIAGVEAELEEDTAALAAATRRVLAAQAQLPGAQAALERARADVVDARARHVAAVEALARAEAAVRAAEARVAATTRAIEAQRAAMSNVAAGAYRDSGIPVLTYAIGHADDPTELSDNLAAMGTALRAQGTIVDDLTARLAQLAAQQAQLELLRDAADTARREAAAQLRRTRDLEQAAADREAEVRGLLADRQDALGQARAAQAEDAARYAGLVAQRARIEALIQERIRQEQLRQERLRQERVRQEQLRQERLRQERLREERARAAEEARRQRLREERRAEARRAAAAAAAERERAEEAERTRRADRADARRRARAAEAAAERAADRAREAERDAEAAQERAEERRRERAAERAAERRRERQEGSSGGSSSGSSGSSSGGLAYPIFGVSVTSRYGMRVHPITGVYKLHDGTDFGAGCGTPVRAAASGAVVYANYLGGYGNQVLLDNGSIDGDSISTSYSHLSRFAVSSGERVSQGETIGYVGNTGYSTGCHLHFMVYVDGSTVNPMGRL